jgi:hypothetical protein
MADTSRYLISAPVTGASERLYIVIEQRIHEHDGYCDYWHRVDQARNFAGQPDIIRVDSYWDNYDDALTRKNYLMERS